MSHAQLVSLDASLPVKEAAISCIQLLKERSHETLALDLSRLDEQQGRMVRFCGLITGMSQEDEYVLPLRLSKDGDWSNLALFQEPGQLDSDDETDIYQIRHADLILRRSIIVTSPSGWSSWAREAFGAQSLHGPVQVVLYAAKDMESCRLGRAHEFVGVLSASSDTGCSAVVHLVRMEPSRYGLGYCPLLPKGLSMESSRSSLLEHLSAVLDGNASVAKLLLAHLVSRMYVICLYSHPL